MVDGQTVSMEMETVADLKAVHITFAALLVGRSRDRFPVVSLDFSVTYLLPTFPWLWGRLSS